jgi:hypothetical protein
VSNFDATHDRGRLDRSAWPELVDAGNRALDDLGVPGDVSALIHGSIPEGFGNPYSDLDILVILQDHSSASGSIQQTIVSYLDRSYRAEIVFTSETSVRDLASRVNSIDQDDGQAFRAARSLLEPYQRFCFGIPARGEQRVRELQASFDPDHLSRLLQEWYRWLASQLACRASAALVIGDAPAAGAMIQTLASAIGKNWATRHGETYVKEKFLALQLKRGGLSSDLAECIWRLAATDNTEPDLQAPLATCISVARDLGLEIEVGTGGLTIEPARDVSSWTIGGRTYLLRDRTDLYVLNRRTALIWKQIERGGFSDFSDANLAALRELHRSGLVQVSHPGMEYPWTQEARLNTNDSSPPVITTFGALFLDDTDREVRWISIPVDRFVRAGVNLVYISTRIEARREDAAGAYLARQWEPLTVALRKIVMGVCQCWLSSNGVYPLPSDPISALSDIPSIPESVSDAARRLRGLRIECEDDVAAVDTAVENFVDRLPNEILSARLRTSDASLRTMASAMVIGRPWLAIATHLGLPVDIGIDGISVAQLFESLPSDRSAKSGAGVGQLKLEPALRQLGFERKIRLSDVRRQCNSESDDRLDADCP